MNAARSVYVEAFTDGLKLDPDLTVAQWANQYRVLSQKGAAEPGPYRIERTPYLLEIAQNLSPRSPFQRIIFMKSAQVGASELGFSWIGYVMDITKGPMLMVQPTTELAEKISKQRIATMIDETPRLRSIVGPEKAKTTGQTILLKEWPGGILSIVGANSGAGLRSMPARWIFFDEADAAPQDVGGNSEGTAGEGDPLSLAEKRAQTYKARKKIFVVSTPLVKETSRIEREYLAGDQRRYFVPCPLCGVEQILEWAQIHYEDNDPQTARYKCKHCEGLIEERHKHSMLTAGAWVPTVQGDGITISYHISALYSPWMTWTEVVADFLKSKNDPSLLKTFCNTVLGESWSDEKSSKLGAEDLKARVEFYPAGVAPADVLVCSAGVDVQDNRFAISVYGYGVDEEAWLISHQEIFGDPAKPEIWKQLDIVLSKDIPHAGGGSIKVDTACIDSGGHYTHEVYQFTRDKRAKKYLAIKGQSQKGKPAIGKPSLVDVNYRGQTLKSGAQVYPVGSDTVKSLLYGRLKLNEPGPGFVHFHADAGDDFFDQLTAEKQTTRYVKGKPVREWVLRKSGLRNEALDCAVYAYAALQNILNRYDKKTVWAQLQKKRAVKPVATANNDRTGQNKATRTNMKPTRKGFVKNW